VKKFSESVAQSQKHTKGQFLHSFAVLANCGIRQITGEVTNLFGKNL
jgi:hypothetical protein